MFSLSATKDQAMEEYAWMEFEGPRGKEVSQRTHKRKISNGTVFGIKSLRSGSRFTIIFPDLLHINFPIDKTVGMYLLDRSKKLRKIPDLGDRTSRKSAGIQSTRRQQLRRDFSAERFSPKAVPNESVAGISLENYQWRIVPEKFQLTHSKGREVFSKNELIGVRFLRASKGGIVVNREGLFLKVNTDEYDGLIRDTKLLPIQDWPNGFIDSESMKLYKRDRTKAAQRAIQDTKEAMRLQARAANLQAKLEGKERGREEREERKAEEERLATIRQKIKSGEMEAPERKTLETLPEHIARTSKTRAGVRLVDDVRLMEEEQEELEEDIDDFNDSDPDLRHIEDDESTESPAEYDIEKILVQRPVSAPTYDLEAVFGQLFGTAKDEEEEEDSPFDLSALGEEDEDDDQDSGRKGKRGTGDSSGEDSEEKGTTGDGSGDEDESGADSDGDDAEDDSEDDESDDDSEDDEDESDDDDSDDDSDDEEDSEEDADDDSEDDDSEEDEPDEEDTDGDSQDDEQEESDGDADSDGDEDEDDKPDAGSKAGSDGPTDDSKPDASATDGKDDEKAKVAKRYAAANDSVPHDSKEPEEGDVLTFNNDTRLKREFVILNVSTHEKSDAIITYRLYNLTDAPDTISIVRVNRARGQSILDQAQHVKDMKPGVFNRIYDMADDLPVDKAPIIS